jgi:hypothetical protein
MAKTARNYLCTRQTLDLQTARAEAEKRFRRLFFFKPKVSSAEIIYSPCWLVKMAYDAPLLVGKKRLRGDISMIVDEAHGVSSLENLDLPLRRSRLDDAPGFSITEEAAVKRAKTDARWKVLYGKYKTVSDLEVKEVIQFYRPHWEIGLDYGGKSAVRLVPADGYSTHGVFATRSR